MFRGAYALSEAAPKGWSASAAPVALIASGSEVSPAQQAQEILADHGIATRLVSAPCPNLFLEQPEDYRRSVIPPGARTVVVEAAEPKGWERLAGCDALLIGVSRFGASAPWKVIAEKLGFTAPQIADRVLRWLGA